MLLSFGKSPSDTAIHKSAGNASALSQRFVATQPMPSASSTANLPIPGFATARRALRPITVVLGALVMTGTAFAVLHREDVKETLLRRHARGDWGELCREDWEANERALFGNGRLLSVYHDRAGQKFYIITEYDRSLTTVLLPEDY
jgi:hypothetical protein